MRLLIALVLTVLCCSVYSQGRFSTYVGLGLGGVFEKGFKEDFPSCDATKKPRAALSLSQYVNFSERHSLGVDLIFGGRLFPVDGCKYYDQSSNTVTLSYNNLNSSSYMLRYEMKFGSDDLKIRPFAGIGFGVIDYSYSSITADESRVSKLSFGVSPMFGVHYSKFQVSMKMIVGGETPSFEGFDTHSGSNKVLTSITSQQLYLNVSYQIFQF